MSCDEGRIEEKLCVHNEAKKFPFYYYDCAVILRSFISRRLYTFAPAFGGKCAFAYTFVALFLRARTNTNVSEKWRENYKMENYSGIKFNSPYMLSVVSMQTRNHCAAFFFSVHSCILAQFCFALTSAENLLIVERLYL